MLRSRVDALTLGSPCERPQLSEQTACLRIAGWLPFIAQLPVPDAFSPLGEERQRLTWIAFGKEATGMRRLHQRDGHAARKSRSGEVTCDCSPWMHPT